MKSNDPLTFLGRTVRVINEESEHFNKTGLVITLSLDSSDRRFMCRVLFDDKDEVVFFSDELILDNL